MKTLKVGDKLNLQGIDYKVKDYPAYHLETKNELNQAIFDKLDIEGRHEYIRNIVGYKPGCGGFPTVKSLEDLTKVVIELQKLCDKQYTITATQFRESMNQLDICKEWKDRLFDELGKDLLLNDKAIVSDKLISDMYDEANTKAKEVLDLLFPGFNKHVKANDIEIGETMLSDEGRLLLRTYVGLVDLNDPNSTYTGSTGFKGKKVTIEIKVIE